MADTAAPMPALGPATMDSLGAAIAQEVSDRAARLMRLQAIQERLQAAKAAYAKVLQDVAECHQAFQAEMGQTA